MSRISKTMIRRLQKKDEETFVEIYNQTKRLVFHLAYHLAADKTEVEDLVQEIFLKMLDNIYRFDFKKAKFETWFYHLAKNHIIDSNNRHSTRNKNIVLDNEVIDYTSYHPNTLLKSELTEVEKLVGSETYQILLLKDGYGLSIREIAEELNLSFSRVRRIYENGVKIVKKHYSNKK